MTQQIINANDLRNGRVVYFTPEGGWSEDITEALILNDEQTAEETLKKAQNMEDVVVVEAYLIDVETRDGTVLPTKYRELIRAKGPTNRLDLGKQAS